LVETLAELYAVPLKTKLNGKLIGYRLLSRLVAAVLPVASPKTVPEIEL
jgi:hypothetical protein